MAKEDYVSVCVSLIRVILAPVIIYIIATNGLGFISFIAFIAVALTDTADGAVRIIMSRFFHKNSGTSNSIDTISDIIYFGSVMLFIIINYFPLLALTLTREVMVMPKLLKAENRKKISITKFEIRHFFLSKATTFFQAVTISAVLLNSSQTNFLIPYLIGASALFGFMAGVKYLTDPKL